MSDAIRMSKNLVECFTATVKFAGGLVEVIYVPRFKNRPGWVGPGFWEKILPNSQPPAAYNNRV